MICPDVFEELLLVLVNKFLKTTANFIRFGWRVFFNIEPIMHMNQTQQKPLSIKTWDKLILKYLMFISFTVVIIILLVYYGQNEIPDSEGQEILARILVALVLTVVGEIILLIRVIFLRILYPNKLLIIQRKQLILDTFKQFGTLSSGDQAKYYPEGRKYPQLASVLNKRELVYGHVETSQALYCFTPLALIILDNSEPVKINIKDVIEVEGNVYPGHQLIQIKTVQGQEYSIEIGGLPNRLKKLFYQLISQSDIEESLLREVPSDVIQVYQFTGPIKLHSISEEILPEELSTLGFEFFPSDVYRRIKFANESARLQYHGEYDEQEGVLYPDDEGLMVLQLVQEGTTLELFNSFTDGYDGIKAAKTITQSVHFTSLENVSEVVLRYSYAIKEADFEAIVNEMQLDSISEINNLFSTVQIYVLKDGQPHLLAFFKTQNL
ncbi:hypothetical protein BKI52_24005 [marine bacterium AO1-C]|nr:hypothetical protein BKI52_24005 [marine bacterium AO1-C]